MIPLGRWANAVAAAGTRAIAPPRTRNCATGSCGAEAASRSRTARPRRGRAHRGTWSARPRAGGIPGRRARRSREAWARAYRRAVPRARGTGPGQLALPCVAGEDEGREDRRLAVRLLRDERHPAVRASRSRSSRDHRAPRRPRRGSRRRSRAGRAGGASRRGRVVDRVQPVLEPVTTPKLPPPPRIAQKSSGCESASTGTISPSAVTISAASRLSIVRPNLRTRKPMPPPTVSPPMPTDPVSPKATPGRAPRPP